MKRSFLLVAFTLLVAVSACKKKPGKIMERFADDDQALALAARFLPSTPVILEAGADHGETTVAAVFKELATGFAPEAPGMADRKPRKGTSWHGNSIFVRK